MIAETRDLPTPFARIVVTDDAGRFVVPDLPDASYEVWVRGYGLVDSPRVAAAPGETLELRAVPAPNEREAAFYYPGGYWFSLMRVPAAAEFPGTGEEGNGISPRMSSQAEWRLNTRLFEETGDEELAQGWTALIMDTNGNGRRDDYVEPDQPVNPALDKRFGGAFYAVAPAPDGSVWGTFLRYPGAVIRLVPGSDPPATALAEVYELPVDARGIPIEGFGARGGDVDRDGVYWVALASGHLASFDRRKCRGLLNGPTATGQHCHEGWSFYPEPLPQNQGLDLPGSAEASYYTWLDQFNTLGLGPNVPINTGNGAEGLLVFRDGEWIVPRVPYPLGFYTKWVDGRIDDANAGWKGRGVWATVSTRTPFHMEGGTNNTSKVLQFQIRPDPLAR